MNKITIGKKLSFNFLFEKLKQKNKKDSEIQIQDTDIDCEMVKLDKVGITQYGQGVLILKTEKDKAFPISAFSPETAKNILDFQNGKRDEIPSIYRLVERICEESELLLVKVRIYSIGEVLRANLYFTGKKNLILRNYRASDAIALATFYSIPILIKKNVLQSSPKINLK